MCINVNTVCDDDNVFSWRKWLAKFQSAKEWISQ
jgi:hypothetical protein